MATQTPLPGSASSTAATASSTSTLTPTAVFVTPALTTTFTPPPQCTEDRLTMLENQAYFVWLNEPAPVPNTTFSECYPPQFMTSYLQMKSSTILPAFSPLVCPDNYYTVFNQTVTERPLYVACCPSNFGFHPPETSTPGRPAYGGTCYSNILTTSITQYDNSSSSGVMLFTTSGQAYAHPIDGFALDAADAPAAASATITGAGSSGPTAASNAVVPASNQLQMGAIAGIVIGVVAILISGIALLIFYIRGRNMSIQRKAQFDMAYHDHRRMREDWQKALSDSNEKSATATLNSSKRSYVENKVAEMGSGEDCEYGKVAEMGSRLTWVPELPPHTPQELEASPVTPPPRNPARALPKRTSSRSVQPDSALPPPPPRSPARKRASLYRDPLNNWPAVPTRASLQFPQQQQRARAASVDTNKDLPTSPPSALLPEFPHLRRGPSPEQDHHLLREDATATTLYRPARDGSRSHSSTTTTTTTTKTVSPAGRRAGPSSRSRSRNDSRNQSRNGSRGNSSHRAVSPMESSSSGSTSRMLQLQRQQQHSPSSISSPSLLSSSLSSPSPPSSRTHSRESNHCGSSSSSGLSSRGRPSPALSDFLNTVNQLSPVSMSPTNSLVDYRTRT